MKSCFSSPKQHPLTCEVPSLFCLPFHFSHHWLTWRLMCLKEKREKALWDSPVDSKWCSEQGTRRLLGDQASHPSSAVKYAPWTRHTDVSLNSNTNTTCVWTSDSTSLGFSRIAWETGQWYLSLRVLARIMGMLRVKGWTLLGMLQMLQTCELPPLLLFLIVTTGHYKPPSHKCSRRTELHFVHRNLQTLPQRDASP